jgi:hypothetical protein
MKSFIKVTKTADTGGGEIWVSKYQIVYLEPDERHSQTYIYYSDKELKVIESVPEILNQIEE